MCLSPISPIVRPPPSRSLNHLASPSFPPCILSTHFQSLSLLLQLYYSHLTPLFFCRSGSFVASASAHLTASIARAVEEHLAESSKVQKGAESE